MSANEEKSLNLFRGFLIVILLLLAIIFYFIVEFYNSKNIDVEKMNELNSRLEKLEEKIDEFATKNEVSDDNQKAIETKEISYIEMTQGNYEKYTSNDYSYRIQEMIDNKDGTITIKGRVYEYNRKASYELRTEMGMYDGTDVYMEITLNENLNCTWGNQEITLREEYDTRKENDALKFDDEDSMKFPLLNDEFVFENSKCVGIHFSNV